MDANAATAAIHPGGAKCFWCRVAIDPQPMPAAAPTRETPMKTATSVSIRPWPNGWLSSGGRIQKREAA